MNADPVPMMKRAGHALLLGVTALVHVPLLVSLAIMLVLLVPKFSEMFQLMGGELPTVTRIVITVGMHVRQWWPIWLAMVPLVLIADAGVVSVLARYSSRIVAWGYTFAVAVVVTVIGVGIFLSLYVPLFQMTTSLGDL
jgi:type II secretory pathway component PulF